MTGESDHRGFAKSMSRVAHFFNGADEPNISVIQLKGIPPTWSATGMVHDIRGLALSGATAASLPRFEAAVRQLNLYIEDPVATVDQALAESPDFVMAHALRAWLHLLGTEPAGVQIARASLAAAQKLPATDREQGHLTAIGHLVEGRWWAASQVLEDITI